MERVPCSSGFGRVLSSGAHSVAVTARAIAMAETLLVQSAMAWVVFSADSLRSSARSVMAPGVEIAMGGRRSVRCVRVLASFISTPCGSTEAIGSWPRATAYDVVVVATCGGER